MQAVADTEHFRACIAARPSNRERLLKMDKGEFIRVMEMWREHFIRAANMPIIGATEEQLRRVKAPACIIAGNDRIHAPETARKLASLLPDCEFHDDVVSKHPDNDLLAEWDKQEWASVEPRMLEIFTAFLRRQPSAADALSPEPA